MRWRDRPRIRIRLGVGASIVLALVAACSARSIASPVASTAPSNAPSPTGSSVAATGTATVSTASPGPPTTAAPAPAILVGAGDIASCGSAGDEATAKLLDGIEGTVFTAGDNVYDSGTPKEFADCYGPTWGQVLARTLPAPGNHDYGTRKAAGYFAYFGATAGDPGQGWYARDIGAWRIYVLNSNCWAVGGCGAGSPQEQWLRDDLAANPRACVLAIWHHPRFSSGEHGSSSATRALWQALEDAGAEIVVSGHDHDYERFAAQTATGTADDRGIIELVVGTGGRSHYAFRQAVANSVVRNDTTFGVIEFRLYAGSWTFTFVPVAGETFTDGGSGTCH